MSIGDALDARALDRRIRIERQVSAATASRQTGCEDGSPAMRSSMRRTSPASAT